MNSTERLLQDIRDQLVQYARNDPGAKGRISNQAKRLNTLRNHLDNEEPQNETLSQAQVKIVEGYQYLIQHSFEAAAIYDMDGKAFARAQELLRTYYEER